ncbi:hypothetical protein Droror1_Dr00010782 [Drosera rotundifolia]
MALAAVADLDLRRPTIILLHHHRRRVLFGCSISSIHRRLSTGADSEPPPAEFDEVENAYEILGVFEGCSCEEIKAAFRRLAKETHPDVVEKGCDEGSSSRFVRIVAAYEILSDPRKRAQYDRYLSSQKKVVRKTSEQGSSYHMYASYTTTTKQMEVVEWLRWYRYAVKEILAGKVVHGTGYFDEIERNFYAAIHAAYHGPEIEIFDFLPDRFEAEVRSVYDTPEVLHLVSGRDLFGMVRMVDKFLELSNIRYEKLSPSGSIGLRSPTFLGNEMPQNKFAGMKFNQVKLGGQKTMKYHATDAYKNLELHLFGKLVATATRAPPDSRTGDLDEKEAHDQIHVFLSSRDESSGGGFSKTTMSDNTHLDILVGTISGLGTNPEESSCYVYDRKGSKTHVILKHRTLLVKHMHWFQLGDEISICECRCTRARMPPSKYWLFEPRCSMHDIGGWYVETYGRDKKARTVPSRRYWDGADADPPSEKRLHPAVYLLGLAYRTLDIESVMQTKPSIWQIVQGNVFKVINWCKKLI